ncbi:alpha/beta fold hydrolase [Variovorax sp. Sphag1AA]|uniref:alpha/beta fold hydrolase n=1 Tax=Variovorax sp. Sphag1AA TaxID=2587027 RepID=UPI00162018CF|nr:alpha/beta fold hydrolase [Variovorax sp. Sphag1AA]MBB3178946.1 pimeloyl-ACP methyl ester carboxylesterase [Variovorax sp. Sphag1AA]
MLINYVRRGEGKPLLLVHGLGGNWRSWRTVLGPLAAKRSVTAIDLPGFGKSPPLAGEVSIRTMSDAVSQFLREHDLLGTDAVGSSVGAQLVLELARRGGVVGAVVSLAPVGFWAGWERHAYRASVCFWWRIARLMKRPMPAIATHEWSRGLLLKQLSAQPSLLSGSNVLEEMRSCATSVSFGATLDGLVRAAPMEGIAAGSPGKRLVIGWGRSDRICFPRQAGRALKSFPDAQLHWFERCGHYPHWDAPDETASLILKTTAD